jgi:hypothetical protein
MLREAIRNLQVHVLPSLTDTCQSELDHKRRTELLYWSIELNRPLLSYAKLSEAAVKAIPATDAISK